MSNYIFSLQFWSLSLSWLDLKTQFNKLKSVRILENPKYIYIPANIVDFKDLET
jgi:hypothetical protein